MIFEFDIHSSSHCIEASFHGPESRECMDPAYHLHIIRTNGSDLDPLLGGEVKVNIALSHVSLNPKDRQSCAAVWTIKTGWVF